ncbi:MAG: flagellar filament capping protein FliD [Nitrospinota bacterium]|nr:flagellar filament capping protein FliD [Nitrospinota bacterium]
MTQAAIFGLNSGLDTAGIIENLVALRKRSTDIVLAKRELEQGKLASFQELKSRLQTFKSITFDLSKESRFLSVAGSFANNNATSTINAVDITTNSLATSGTFSLKVNSLAQEGKVISQGVNAITDSIPEGTLEITVGNTITLVDINSSNNTQDGLRQAINNSGADVKASFINVGSSTDPIKVLISGTKTGANNNVSVKLFKTTLGGGPISTFSFTETQTAQDASLEMGGIAVTKSSNTITDVIDGTTLNLKAAGSGIITLQSDVNAIKEKVISFVDGFNNLMAFINGQTFLDTDTNTAGLLFGNFTTQNLQSTLRSVISSKITGTTGTFDFLSQVGMSTGTDGLLELDQGELVDAINLDASGVSQLFASKGTSSNTNVTFIGFTGDTKAGTYDVKVTNGVPQLSLTGKNDFIDATGSGTLFAGAEGTSAEDLNFNIASTAIDGSFGTITLSLGVGEILNREIANLTDFSRGGPLSAEIDTSTETIRDFELTAIDQEERLLEFEQNLRARFTNLEVVVGRLNSQRDAFSSSISGLQSISGATRNRR